MQSNGHKYIIEFGKEGTLRYTSHLDLLRLFQRILRRCGIPLVHSQGFNPHPKMSFAQPLSLGYTATHEMLEIETVRPLDLLSVREELGAASPEGLTILDVRAGKKETKSLAGATRAAWYTIVLPVTLEDTEDAIRRYLSQDAILAEKRQKKTKEMVAKDIKPMILDLTGETASGQTVLKLHCACGSQANLSPEQVIATFLAFTQIPVPRYEIQVCRDRLEM